MTRPRPSRAARLRLASQQRAEADERQMVMIERELAAIESLARMALMTRIAYNKGRIPKARYEAIITRLTRELDAMSDVRSKVAAQDCYDPPAMKS